MEPSSQPQPAIIDIAGGSQAYSASAYPPAATVAVLLGGAPAGSQPAPSFLTNLAQLNAQNQLIYEQAQQFNQWLQPQQQRQVQQFWAERLSDIEQVTDFKNHTLPLTRIKKIMRADEDVPMISAEAPVIFAKACEIFILELTLRSWMQTKENKRRTFQKNDLAAIVTRTDVYDFLVDIFPSDEMREEGVGLPPVGQPPLGAPNDAYPYYYLPQLQVPGASMGYGGQQVPHGDLPYAWHDPQE